MAGLLRGLAADAVWRTGTDRFEGLAALEDLFEAWLCTMDPSLETYTSFADGNRVAAQMLEQLTIDGKVRQMNIAVFLKVKGSLGVLPVGVMSICRRPAEEITVCLVLDSGSRLAATPPRELMAADLR